MENYICVTCGTQYPASGTPPASCPICEDERQYVNHKGQQWIKLADMRGRYHNIFNHIDAGVAGIKTEPTFAIGQQAYLLPSRSGALLWDCLSYLNEATISEIKRRGGLAAIAISHPHFFSSMVEWSHAFDAPIYLHADHEPWVMRPDSAIQYWEGETKEVLPGLTLIRCGGHFPGSSVLHWAEGASGKGALFTSDTMYVVSDRRYVSFMYSFPNLVPINAAAVRQIVAAVEHYPFDRIYGGWNESVIPSDAKEALHRSAERYIEHIQD